MDRSVTLPKPEHLELHSLRSGFSGLKKLTWPALILAASPHLKTVTTAHVFGVQFDWLFYGVCMLIVGLRPGRLFAGAVVPLVLVLSLSLLPSILAGYWDPSRSLVDLLSFWIIYSACLEILRTARAKCVIRAYVFFTFLVACWGIIELALGLIPSYGLDGLAYEPSHFVIASAPAAYYALNNPDVSRWVRIVIPAAILLTLSTTALIMSVVIAIMTFRRYLIVPLFLMMSLFLSWQYSPQFRSRVELRLADTFVDEEAAEMTKFGSNKTTISLLSNMYVAQKNASIYFPFGAGFSNHGENYDRHFNDDDFRRSNYYRTNQKSGHNVGVRFFSEFGYLGLGGMLFFFLRVWRTHRSSSLDVRLVVSMALVHVLAKCVKLGSYLDYGTPLFVTVLWFMLTEHPSGHFKSGLE